MKFLEILLAFLSSQGKTMVQNNAEAVKENLANNFRRIAALLLTSLIASALFCVSISLALSRLLAAYEQLGVWSFSTTVTVSLVISLLCLAVLVFALGEKRWHDAVGRPTEKPADAVPPPRSGGPDLQAAVALLIVEVIQEIKARRQHASTTSTEAPPL